ncbi:hypothetical protein BASA81_001934 [Batrachochytrium salamandrivorans]|nr:hypothetical protein BASA81_001934 [Batrachochytrium salamandrivorans]
MNSKRGEELKEEGNKLFERGDNAGASSCYTEALDLLGEAGDLGLKRVLLSNRSAARLRAGDFLAALGDAEDCVKLAPAWSRGLGRKAMALLRLYRYAEAETWFTQALLGDPQNASLVEHLELAKNKQQPQGAVQNKSREAGDEEEEDPLASLFADVAQLEQMVEKKPTMVDHDAECLGWTPANQLARVLAKHHKFLNLNPYHVFGLGLRANAEDIKRRYHKLSSLLHPDKNADQQAAAAFEYVTWAHSELKDENRRQFYLETFALAKQQVERTRAGRPAGATSALTLDEEVELEIKKTLALVEQNRVKAEKTRQNNEELFAKSGLAKEPNWAEFKRDEDAFKEGAEDRGKQWAEFQQQQKRHKKS